MDLLALGKTPISDDQPAGAEVRYEPEFEQLQAEIDKLSVPSASGGLDWQKVCDLAALILAEKSKNLLVASYLAVSQVHLNGIDGLALGLHVIHDMLDQFWDNLFPTKKRLRGRIGAIEWWVEKTAAALEALEIEALAAEKLAEITDTLSGTDAILKEKLPDEPPLLRPIQRIIERIPSEEKEKPPPQPAPAPQPAQAQPQPARPAAQPAAAAATAAAPAAPAPSDDIRTDADVRKVLNSWQQSLRKIAAFYLENDDTNPLAYRCRRIAAWSQLAVLPPDNDGITQFSPPPPQVVQVFKDFRENANYGALIEAAEQRLSQFMYWFDLNRWVAEAMDFLGDGYQEAREVVCQETAYLLHRLAGLRDLAFSDGTPFADAETQRWLDSIEFNAAGMAAPVPAVEGSQTADQPDAAADAIQQAAALAKKKKLVEAVQLLQQKLQHCFSQKEALTWRLAMSQILIESRRMDLALPQLDLILRDIDTYQLVSWDPALALQGLKLAWAGYNSHKDNAYKKNAEAILNRIAELDPVEALALKK